MIVEKDNVTYNIIRRLRIDNKPILDSWKSLLDYDEVIEDNGFYYLCKIVEEIDFEEVIEPIKLLE